jgi:ssDNA-binding Zn-finger/Zn-ribbon topoisomerase 1
MRVYKEMDPELARRLIEGYQDELTPELKAQDAFYRKFRCPRCKGALKKEVDARTAFTGDGLIPKALLRCPNCRYLIDPHTNLVVEFGDASKIPFEAIPTIGGE